VNNVAVTLEHVDLLNCLDGLDVQLLEDGLELLVIVAASRNSSLLLVSRGSLATYFGTSIPSSGQVFFCRGLVQKTYRFVKGQRRQTSS
jgi:hypothetical protein